MTPVRFAAGCLVLVLHVLIVWAFVLPPPMAAPRPREVQVVLIPTSTPPKPLPPPRPPALLLPRTAVQTPPEIMILAPPPQIHAPAPPAALPSAPEAAALPAPPAHKPPPPDYLSRLAAYLNEFKTYPYGARRRREQGTVRLHFVMDRAGNVLSAQIAGSSGWTDLDDEARALIQRAEPLPSVPKDYPGETLDLIVPIVFSLP